VTGTWKDLIDNVNSMASTIGRLATIARTLKITTSKLLEAVD
jgi:hypothetical protein